MIRRERHLQSILRGLEQFPVVALLRNTSESLAGRVVFHELGGLNLEEAPSAAMDDLWLRGGLPRAFLAAPALPAPETAPAPTTATATATAPSLALCTASPHPICCEKQTFKGHYQGPEHGGMVTRYPLAISKYI